MIDGQRVVAIIPARGGSKSVPDKNLQLLGGKPLVAWSIEVAQATEAVDHVVVSTDSDKIRAAVAPYDVAVAERPAALATDDALVIDAVKQLLSSWKEEGVPVDLVVLLEPTCPLRSPDDIVACLQLLKTHDSVATFTEATLNPHRAWKIVSDTPETFIPGAVPWQPRQALPEAYQLNGAVYAFRADRLPPDALAPLFGRAAAVRMPRERSVDVDSAVDLALANLLVLS